MKEILKKVVDETAEMLKEFSLSKIIFYWNMPYNGVYTTAFNVKNEETRFFSDDLSLRDIKPVLISNFFTLTEEINKERKINKGTLTIYPNGEYENAFIWDEQAHLGYLVDYHVADFFRWSHEQISDKLVETLLPDVDWQKAEVTLSFKLGKVQPISIKAFVGDKTMDFVIEVNDIALSYWEGQEKAFEEMYILSQREDIKPLFQGEWNKAIIYIQKNQYYISEAENCQFIKENI